MHNRIRIGATVVALLVGAIAQGNSLAADAPPPMTVPGAFGVNSGGAATYSIPITAPPGTAGMVPSLALDYSSQGGDGIVGWQWSLSGLSFIVRCPRTKATDNVHGGVNYDSNDRFCLDGQRLILTSGTYGADSSEYRTEVDTFTKVIAHSSAGSGPAWFEVHLKSGQTLQYGYTTGSTGSRLLAVGTSTVRVWAVDKVTDTKGNYLTVTYDNDATNGQIYPDRIDYTGNSGASLSPYNSVRFTYASRSDVVPIYQAGSLQQTTVVLTHIKTYQGSNVVYDYQLAYRSGTSIVHSRLTSVTLCDAAGTACLAPTTFSWQGGSSSVSFTSMSLVSTGISGYFNPAAAALGDYNGDGRPDVMNGWGASPCPGSGNVFNTGNGDGTFTGAGNFSGFCPSFFYFYPVGDFDGDGRTDIVAAYSFWGTTSIDLYSNTGSAMSHLSPSYSTLPLVGDYDGDGRLDFYELSSSGTAGPLHIGNGNGTWGSTSASIALTNASADFDGDGCDDVQSWGSGTSWIITYGCNPAQSSSTTSGTPSTILRDFNGDGKADVLGYLSTGTGFVAMGSSPPSNVVGAGDFNGDGRNDLVVQNSGSSAFDIYLSTGNGFSSSASVSYSGYTVVADAVADWNGDGVADFWISSSMGGGSYTVTLYLSDAVPELITAVSNGVGATTTVTYDRLNKNGSFYSKGSSATYPTQDVDGALYAVKQVDRSNGIGGNYTATYTYAGAKKDLQGRGSLGFSTITMTDAQTGIVTTTNYRTDFPYLGQVSSQTRVLSSVTLSSVTNTWASSSTAGVGGLYYYFVSLSQIDASGHDLNGATLPSTTTTFSYDSYGNPTTIAVSVSDGSSRTATNTYTNDTTNWILGQLDSKSVRSIVGSSDITRKSCSSHQSGTGLVTREVIEPTTGSCAYSSSGVQTDYTLDSFGNRTAAAVTGGGSLPSRTTGTTFDSAGEFATATTNALSQSDSWSFSAAFGLATAYTDPNGAVTAWSYDTFGRLTQETAPVGTKTLVSYAYCSGVNGGSASCPTYGAYLKQITPTASNGTTQIGPLSTVYYDALGRVIAADTQGFDGSNIRIATQYDSSLNVSQASRPYFTSGGTVKWTAFTYDALGRVTQATFPDSSVATYGFNGLTTTATNNLSQVTTTLRNAQGLVYTVTDAASHATTYAYDAFGSLKTVTDYAGNVISNTFDTRGNKTASTDPDMGSWSYTYDVLGELLTQTDAKSQTTTLTYDLLGRPLTRAESSFYTAWTYGTSSGSHNIGRPTQAKTCTGSGCSTVIADRTFTYDSLGRPSAGALAVGGTTYTTTTSYDSYGRIATAARPSGFTEQRLYNGYGYLCRITDNGGSHTCTSTADSHVLWTPNTLNAELQLTQATAGNSVVTTRTYDANTGRLTNVRAGPSDAVAQFDYTWDTIGNLTYRSDSYQGVYERYCYDSLNRLTASATGGSGVTACTSSGSGITTKTVAYDAIGNITSKSDVGTYSYPSSGSARPHAISSISGTVNGVTNPSYTYDANGNMTAGAGRSVSYTAFNMADTITQGSTTVTFTYDSGRQRVTQASTVSGTTTTTTYLNDPASGAMGEKAVTGGTTTWRDYINAAGAIVAERACTGSSPCSSGATWTYHVSDSLGSAAVLTNSSGAVTERLSYDAWGRRRNANGTDSSTCSVTSASTRGYTGHEMIDAVCEINANARIYDPTVARFMTPDAIIPDLFDMQSLNRFSYVLNNPLSLTDPTGNMGTGPDEGQRPCAICDLRDLRFQALEFKRWVEAGWLPTGTRLLTGGVFNGLAARAGGADVPGLGGGWVLGTGVGGMGGAGISGTGKTGYGFWQDLPHTTSWYHDPDQLEGQFSGPNSAAVASDSGAYGLSTDGTVGPFTYEMVQYCNVKCGANIFLHYTGKAQNLAWIQSYAALSTSKGLDGPENGTWHNDANAGEAPFYSKVYASGPHFQDWPAWTGDRKFWAQTTLLSMNSDRSYRVIATVQWGYTFSTANGLRPSGVLFIVPAAVQPNAFQRSVLDSVNAK